MMDRLTRRGPDGHGCYINDNVGQVDHRQTPVPEAGIVIDVTPVAVRTASCEPVYHSMDTRLVGRGAIKPDFAAYSTHIRTGARDEGRVARNVLSYCTRSMSS